MSSGSSARVGVSVRSDSCILSGGRRNKLKIIVVKLDGRLHCLLLPADPATVSLVALIQEGELR